MASRRAVATGHLLATTEGRPGSAPASRYTVDFVLRLRTSTLAGSTVSHPAWLQARSIRGSSNRIGRNWRGACSDMVFGFSESSRLIIIRLMVDLGDGGEEVPARGGALPDGAERGDEGDAGERNPGGGAAVERRHDRERRKRQDQGQRQRRAMWPAPESQELPAIAVRLHRRRQPRRSEDPAADLEVPPVEGAPTSRHRPSRSDLVLDREQPL